MGETKINILTAQFDRHLPTCKLCKVLSEINRETLATI